MSTFNNERTKKTKHCLANIKLHKNIMDFKRYLLNLQEEKGKTLNQLI